MIDLNKMAQEAVDKLVNGTVIQEKLEKEVNEAVVSGIQSHFRYNSDFRKDLEDKIKAEMKVDLSKIKFSEYNHLLLDLVRKEVDQHVTGEGLENFRKRLNEILKEDAPEVVKMQEIVDWCKEEFYDDEDYDVHVHWECRNNNDNYFHITISEAEYSSTKVKLFICPPYQGGAESCTIVSFEVDGNKHGTWKIGDDVSISFGEMYGITRKLFKMFTSQTKIDMSNFNEDYLDLYHNSTD